MEHACSPEPASAGSGIWVVGCRQSTSWTWHWQCCVLRIRSTPEAVTSTGIRPPRRAQRTPLPAAESADPRPPARSASPVILHQCMPDDDDLGTTSCLSPRHRTRPRLQPAVVRLHLLLAYRSVRCQATGSSSSSTTGHVGVRSVMTSIGRVLVRRANDRAPPLPRSAGCRREGARGRSCGTGARRVPWSRSHADGPPRLR